MSKSEYGNPLGNQALSLPDMADAQLEACFDEKTLSGLMSMAEIFNVRKIFITGCGDSIAAAGAFAGVMRKFTGAFHCEMIEPMEFTRFLKKEEAGIGEPDSPLVIALKYTEDAGGFSWPAFVFCQHYGTHCTGGKDRAGEKYSAAHGAYGGEAGGQRLCTQL